MSETWAFVSAGNLSHSREQRTHASGYPMNDYHFKIIDPETGKDQAEGVPGELLIKGYANMQEYWKKNPKRPRQPLTQMVGSIAAIWL